MSSVLAGGARRRTGLDAAAAALAVAERLYGILSFPTVDTRLDSCTLSFPEGGVLFPVNQSVRPCLSLNQLRGAALYAALSAPLASIRLHGFDRCRTRVCRVPALMPREWSERVIAIN